MSNLVIVAIPATQDPVWNVSSEKVPHMTILFLGDAMSNPNVSKIASDVGELCAKYMQPFNLRVDHRGTLGPDEADVLFFSKEVPWQLFDFRAMCLGNNDILSAYNAIPQRMEWTPHLTLGYPKSPARPDDWDPMGTQYVQFDKVAVWFGDFEGTEFQLSANNPKAVQPELAWAEGEVDVLAHHGIKGMRWGVRRANIGSGSEKVVSRDAAKAKGARDKARKQGKDALSNEEMQALVTRMNLEQQMSRLTPPSASSRAGKFVAETLANVAKQQVTRLANDAASKQVDKALHRAGAKK